MDLSTIDRYFYKNLCQKLNNVRINKGKTYRDIAKDTGLSRTTLDNFFLGRSRASDRKFKLICDSLEVNQKNMIELVLVI